MAADIWGERDQRAKEAVTWAVGGKGKEWLLVKKKF